MGTNLLSAVLLAPMLTAVPAKSNSSWQQESQHDVAAQQRALIAAYRLGLQSISSSMYLAQLRGLHHANDRIFSGPESRVAHILIVDEQERVLDSLDIRYAPKLTGKKSQYSKLSDVKLPPVERGHMVTDAETLPDLSGLSLGGKAHAYSFPVETRNAGRLYLIVAIK